ncbi:helix-turn-helix domain-containing protein [Leucobacter sp. Psy1]|uniref:helix-turn-helix domain-containing protein n=1 Tax=Leucobacter sp. Psy1 TaxID=2875729 RepID=UPI001CD5B53F
MELTHSQDGDELLTVAEAAKLLGVSVDTIRRYSRAGTLATRRTPTNHRRFNRGDVIALLRKEVCGEVGPQELPRPGGGES